MFALLVVLAVLLVGSLALNAHQWRRWNAYRSKPSGLHSYTGMIPVIKPTDRGE